MTDQFFKPKPIAYASKNKGLFKNRKIIITILVILLIITLGWLIVKRFSRDPLEKVETLIKSKHLKKAARMNYEMMTRYPEHRLAYLMNGSIINFGLREMNITDTNLPFYEYEDFLNKEDHTGVFIRQSFLKKYSLFPDSTYFLSELCNFSKNYPESLKNPETMITVQRALHSQTHWSSVSVDCINELFNHPENLGTNFGTVTGDNLTIREKPDIKSRVIGKLKKKDIILIKMEAIEDTIGNKKGKWLYVFTKDSIYGWVFGAYVEKK